MQRPQLAETVFDAIFEVERPACVRVVIVSPHQRNPCLKFERPKYK